MQFIAAAALTAALVTSQFSFATVMGDNTATVQVSSLIPNNVTIDQPVPLSDISLPKSDYGTLSWADGSCVPSARVQTYDVVFRPYNTADLAKISGWDGQSDAIYSSVTVVVSSISKDSDYEENQSEQEYTDTENEEQNTEDDVKDTTADNEEENTEAAESEEVPTVTETPENVDNTTGSETVEDKNTADTDSTEVTEAPENADAAENTETPAVTETPAEDGENPEVTEVPVEDKDTPDAVDTPDITETPEITETPTATETPEATVTPEADKDNIFDGTEKNIAEDDRVQSVEETEEPSDAEKARLAETNHTCNGISVSGINLPWYVQFRVASGENYEFTNEAEANVFKSYEFELWDLKNNTEYEIPDGEYLSVTVPVKAGYNYTIEHLLDSGAMETIVPSVEGSTMVFSTHSFSPFGIAGSKALVGEEIEDGSYSSDTTTSSATTTPKTEVTTAASASTGNTVNNTTNSSNSTTSSSTNNAAGQDESSENQNSTSDSNAQSEDASKSNSVGAVETGDNTPILPFVIIGIAAAVIVAVLVYLKKKK